MAGDFGGEAAGDVQVVTQLVGGRGKVGGVVVAGAAQVRPRGGGCRYAANSPHSSHACVDVTGSVVPPLSMAMGLREATVR